MLPRAGTPGGVSELCARIAAVGRVALNFHPDRTAADGRTVAEALLEDGTYRNQFETLISNGGLGAVRERFEERLFAGAYSHVGVDPSERPATAAWTSSVTLTARAPGSVPASSAFGRRFLLAVASVSATA